MLDLKRSLGGTVGEHLKKYKVAKGYTLLLEKAPLPSSLFITVFDFKEILS